MTQKEIIEYNRLCANFIGAKNLGKIGHTNKDYYEHDLFTQERFSSSINDYYVDCKRAVSFMEFDSNWNWIMEVSDRICTLGHRKYVNITENLCVVVFTDLNIRKQTHDFAGGNIVVISEKTTEKETTVDAIYQFLKQYKQ